jgi:Na+/H+ antiporter NhaB
MLHIKTTISRHQGTLDAATFWVFGGILVVIAFRDVLTVLAVVFAIAIAISWIASKVEHRQARNDADMVPVSQLRPASSGQRDLEMTLAA